MEETIITNTPQEKAEKKVIIKGDEKELAKGLNCPRCNSTNTKFCYYNNYSQTQPRYFCKACKRYWTHGGSLRNIPVGGKIRKNKRQSSYVLPNATKVKLPDLIDQSVINPNPKLSLFNHHPLINPQNNSPYDQYKSSYSFDNAPYLSPMEVVSSSSRGSVMASFMPLIQMSEPNPNPNPNPVFPVGFSFQGDYRPSLGFSLDDFGRVDHQDHTNGDHQNGNSTGFWSGNILGGAGSW